MKATLGSKNVIIEILGCNQSLFRTVVHYAFHLGLDIAFILPPANNDIHALVRDITDQPYLLKKDVNFA